MACGAGFKANGIHDPNRVTALFEVQGRRGGVQGRRLCLVRPTLDLLGATVGCVSENVGLMDSLAADAGRTLTGIENSSRLSSPRQLVRPPLNQTGAAPQRYSRFFTLRSGVPLLSLGRDLSQRADPGRAPAPVIQATKIMNPQEKAATGLKLLKEAIVEYLRAENTAIRQTDLASGLGLNQDPNEFTRIFVRSLAQQLVSEGRIGTATRGTSRVYFIAP